MNTRQVIVRAGLGVVVGAMLMACGVTPEHTSGLRDDVKHVDAQYDWKYKKRKAKRVQTAPEKWCIELDNVNNVVNADDKWFRVEQDTYNKFLDMKEGTYISDLPYISNGC